MKKIFTYSITAVLAVLLFTSCAKERVVYDDNSYWLSQERGEVIYSSNYCGIYLVETQYGYTIIENINGSRVYEGDAVYGNFGAFGSRDFYNYSADLITRGNVLEYDMSYSAALDALDYYCPSGRAGGFNLKQSSTSQQKVSRVNGQAKTIK
ncbi:MAG: hypothetical protein Q7T76_02770 [Ferruginibacter sp.]|nr:hypothetical protein [Ferruginibacter sp.]